RSRAQHCAQDYQQPACQEQTDAGSLQSLPALDIGASRHCELLDEMLGKARTGRRSELCCSAYYAKSLPQLPALLEAIEQMRTNQPHARSIGATAGLPELQSLI